MAGVIRVNWGGEIRGGTADGSPALDIWSNTVHVGYTGPTAPDLDDYNADVVTALTTLAAASAAKWNAFVHCLYVKTNEIDVATGLQVTDPTVQADVNIKGTGTPNNGTPISTSLRLSMDNATRNPRARGGFYIPLPTIGLGDNLRVPSATVEGMLGAYESFLAAISTDAVLPLGVYSRASHAIFPVTRLRMGDVPDNISRRKNALVEAYQVATFG